MKRVAVAAVALALIGATTAPPPPPPLSAFLGKYSFDHIEGYTVLSLPVVRNATVAALGNRRDILGWLWRDKVTSGTISRNSGLTLVPGCEPDDCGARNWAVVLKGDGRTAAVCYFTINSGIHGAFWFIGGREVHRSLAEPCPDEADDIDPAIVARLG